MEVMVEQAIGVPEQTERMGIEHPIERVPEHEAKQQPVVEELETPTQNTKADHAVAPGDSGRYRQFKKLNRKTKPAMPRPSPTAGATLTVSVPESPSARQPEEGSTAAPGGPEVSEPLSQTTGAPAMTTETMTGTIDTSGAETGVAGDAPESRKAALATAKEQIVLTEASPGMVRPAVQPQSPPKVPQAMVEEDEVEEIEHTEPQPQSVRIIRKRGEEVVVIEEENTTREMKRLRSTIAGVMTQIEGITRTAELRHQMIKRMEPLAEENKKLREAMNLSEKHIQRSQHERDLTESNARDLEYQKGVLTEKLAAVSEQVQSQSEQLAVVSSQLKSASEQLEKKNEQLNSVSKQKAGTSKTRSSSNYARPSNNSAKRSRRSYQHKAKAQWDMLV
ncbi:golgin candidate 2-like [Miscanthus floridulus]|uniref:golgin candidate 2-like n=1 Tax=Miscanthus floridulus TaxID=154761 RepID=UPI00345AC18B